MHVQTIEDSLPSQSRQDTKLQMETTIIGYIGIIGTILGLYLGFSCHISKLLSSEISV